MSFVEPAFAILLLIAWIGWWLTRRFQSSRLVFILIASLMFYAWHVWWLVFLILGYCAIDWAAARWMNRQKYEGRKHSPGRIIALIIGLTFNLLVLGFWKYTPLIVQSSIDMAGITGWDIAMPQPKDWYIPFGISFYAFTGISYLVDVYRGNATAEKNPLRFFVYICFFPQLMAGPILRPHDFLDQLQHNTLPQNTIINAHVLMLLGSGFFKKMVLADHIGLAIDPYFHETGTDATAGVWAGPYLYLYALQIYFDFSGYTDIARGLGMMFGFTWPKNFNSPYFSRSVKDFWHRWHMTLSTFLRDYLYIPLGGNRVGVVARAIVLPINLAPGIIGSNARLAPEKVLWLSTPINLLITMILGGLWHGANWSFATWGALHGIYLVIQRCWAMTWIARKLNQGPRPVRWVWAIIAWALTFHAVVAAWAFFRVTWWPSAFQTLIQFFQFDPDKMLVGSLAEINLWALLIAWALVRITQTLIKRTPWKNTTDTLENSPGLALRIYHGARLGFWLTLIPIALLLAPGEEAPPFIYFQF